MQQQQQQQQQQTKRIFGDDGSDDGGADSAPSTPASTTGSVAAGAASPSPSVAAQELTMAAYIRLPGGTPMRGADEVGARSKRRKQANAAAASEPPPPQTNKTELETPPRNYAPQLRIVDGKMVLDEQSLVVTAGPAEFEYDEEVVHETMIQATSASFTSRPPAERWTEAETQLFYEGIRMWGTDFHLISQMFPNRNRRQIKNKYKREERANPVKLNQAFGSRKQADPKIVQQITERISQNLAASSSPSSAAKASQNDDDAAPKAQQDSDSELPEGPRITKASSATDA